MATNTVSNNEATQKVLFSNSQWRCLLRLDVSNKMLYLCVLKLYLLQQKSDRWQPELLLEGGER